MTDPTLSGGMVVPRPTRRLGTASFPVKVPLDNGTGIAAILGGCFNSLPMLSLAGHEHDLRHPP